MKNENIKTISKEFVKVDEENIKIIYTRVLDNPLNIKASMQGMEVWRNNLKSAINDINNKTKEIIEQVEAYNEAVEDFDLAEANLKMGIEVPTIITYEDLLEEVLATKED